MSTEGVSHARPTRLGVLGAALLAAAIVPACVGGNTAQLVDAITLWRAGQVSLSVDMARTEYVRFRIANEYSEAQVRAAADEALEALEVPMLPEGELPQASPDEAAAPATDLGTRLRADLLSFRATPVVRGATTVGALGLRIFAPALLTVIFAQRVIEPDGGVLARQGPALRTLAVKRIALDALLTVQGAALSSGGAPRADRESGAHRETGADGESRADGESGAGGGP